MFIVKRRKLHLGLMHQRILRVYSNVHDNPVAILRLCMPLVCVDDVVMVSHFLMALPGHLGRLEVKTGARDEGF